MKTKRHFASYATFWPYYLKEHSKPETKKLHVIGTVSGTLFFLYCFLDRRPLWYPIALILGYGFAWYAHFKVEKNRPATFSHPIWSLISDFRMTYLYLTKKLR